VWAARPTPELMHSAHVFASHRRNAVHTVWTGGTARVNGGQHAMAEPSQRAFAKARRTLLQSSQ